MREILFRGKRIDNGEWVKGVPFFTYTTNSCKMIQAMALHPDFVDEGDVYYSEGHSVDPSTVGQYTGLLDKNGKRIFEGDIVKFKTRMSTFKPHYVRWYEGEARFVVTGKDGARSYPMDSSFEYEVIGYIHDNPELMEGGTDHAE